MRPGVLWQLLREAASQWSEDKAPRMGAALAYYGVFSLAPLLLLAIAVAGLVFGEQAARGEVLGQIQSTVGPTAARAIEDLLKSASHPAQGVTATVVSLVVLLFGASGLFLELQDALNTIWKVAPRPGLGLMAMIRARLLSFAVVLGTGLLLLALLVVSTGLTVAETYVRPLARALPGGPWLWEAVNLVVSILLVAFLFALIYKLLPDAEVAWRHVGHGAVLTAVLFTAGKYAIGLYLGETSISSAFGAAGSVIVILVWVYYSAQILLFGAEFTRAYARRSGDRVPPSPHAVAVPETSHP